MMTYHPQKRCGYGHVTVLQFAVCRDAACRAGSSATAELYVEFAVNDWQQIPYERSISYVLINGTNNVL